MRNGNTGLSGILMIRFKVKELWCGHWMDTVRFSIGCILLNTKLKDNYNDINYNELADSSKVIQYFMYLRIISMNVYKNILVYKNNNIAINKFK